MRNSPSSQFILILYILTTISAVITSQLTTTVSVNIHLPLPPLNVTILLNHQLVHHFLLNDLLLLFDTHLGHYLVSSTSQIFRHSIQLKSYHITIITYGVDEHW